MVDQLAHERDQHADGGREALDVALAGVMHEPVPLRCVRGMGDRDQRVLHAPVRERPEEDARAERGEKPGGQERIGPPDPGRPSQLDARGVACTRGDRALSPHAAKIAASRGAGVA